MSTYSPRIIRDEDGGIDEKIATFFADKALQAIKADVAQDNGITNLARGPRPSLGNVIGMERFAKRLRRQAEGRATLSLNYRIEKKEFSMIWDRLMVANDRLEFYRLTLRAGPRRDPSGRTFSLLSVSRHALIRSVKHVRITSTDDVLHFLKIVWDGAMLLMSVMAALRPTTPGKTCWLVPVPFGEEHLGLMIARPTVEELPTLVTVYPNRWLPDGHAALGQELEDALLWEASREERDPAVLAILARMLK